MMNWVNGGSGMMAGMGLWGLLVLVTVLLLLALAGLGGIWLVRRLRDEPAASPSLSGDAKRR